MKQRTTTEILIQLMLNRAYICILKKNDWNLKVYPSDPEGLMEVQ